MVRGGLAIVAASALACSSASAQPSIGKQVMGLGGGTSTGGDFSLSGTIGQELAAESAGGGLSVCSGYWCGVTVACNLADVASLGAQGGPDGQLTVDDIVVFLNAFFANDLAVADVAALGGSEGGDGQTTVDDIVLFLQRFFQGC